MISRICACVCVCDLTGLFSINNDLVLCYMSLTAWVAYMWSSTVFYFSLWSLQIGWVHSNVSIYDKADNYIMSHFFSPCTSEKKRIGGNIPTKETIEIFIQRSLRGLQHLEHTPISELWMAPTKISNQSMVTAQWQFIIRLTKNSNEAKTHQWPSVPDYGQAHKTCSGVKLVLGT